MCYLWLVIRTSSGFSAEDSRSTIAPSLDIPLKNYLLEKIPTAVPGIELGTFCRIKIGITFIFRFHRRPIQLAVFVPVDLSSICRHLQALLRVEIPSVARPGQLTVLVQITDSFNCWMSKFLRFMHRWEGFTQAGRQNKFRHPTRPAQDVNKLTKGLQERTQVIE